MDSNPLPPYFSAEPSAHTITLVDVHKGLQRLGSFPRPQALSQCQSKVQGIFTAKKSTWRTMSFLAFMELNRHVRVLEGARDQDTGRDHIQAGG